VGVAAAATAVRGLHHHYEVQSATVEISRQPYLFMVMS